MAKNNNFYLVTVEDKVIQLTTYIVKASDADNARQLIASGMYAFESEREIVDTLESEIKTVEGMV